MAWRRPGNLREWVKIIFRHKKKFFFPAVAAAICVMWASRYLPREYRSTAIVERLTDSAMMEMGNTVGQRNLRYIRRQVQDEIRGQQAVEDLMEDLGLMRDLPHTPDGQLTRQGQLAKQDMVSKIRGRVGVRYAVWSDERDRIAISFVSSERELAPKVVNQLSENYIRKTRQYLDTLLINNRQFFEREVARFRNKITELEDKRLRFQMEHPGMLPNDPTSIKEKLIALQAKLDLTTDKLAATKEKRDSLEEWIKSQPEFNEQRTSTTNPLLTELKSRMARLQEELDNNLFGMLRTEEHPSVIQIRARMEQLKKQIALTDTEMEEKVELLPNMGRIQAEREVEMLKGELRALEARRGELARQVDRFQMLERNFFTVRNDYQKITRELRDSQRQVGFWERNLRNTRIALAAELGQRGVRLSFIQRAPELERPSSPNVRTILAAAAIAGFGLGLLMIFTAEMLDHSFHSIEHAVDDLKLPVLGAVNEIITPSEAFRRKVLGWGVYPVVVVAMLIILGASYGLVYLNLNEPLMYEKFVTSPGEFLRDLLF